MGTVECPEPGILAAYADNNLTLDEQVFLEAHLAWCVECRKTVALALEKTKAPTNRHKAAAVRALSMRRSWYGT